MPTRLFEMLQSLSDMLPSLSEAWATAYVQILITLVVFALGIPALAVQLVVQDDVREVFDRRMKVTAWKTSVAILLLAFMSFVWLLHPPFTPGETGAAAAAPQRGLLSVLGPLIASLMMTLLPVVIILLGIKQGRFLSRPVLIQELKTELLAQKPLSRWDARTEPFFKKKRAARQLEKETLHDLIYLGRHGKAGANKHLVLDALDELATVVQSSDNYQGAELQELIRGLCDVVINNEQAGNEGDLNRVLDILKDIRHRLSQKPYTSKYIDAGLTRRVLEELGVEAVRTQTTPQTVERFIEAASEYGYSEIIFKMGLAALENNQFHTATLALNKLEVLADDKSYSNIEEIHDLLGLLAHFAESGTSTRMRADSFLAEQRDAFLPSLDVCLVDAYTHHYSRTYFNTADALYKLRESIRKGEWVPLLLDSLNSPPPGVTPAPAGAVTST